MEDIIPGPDLYKDLFETDKRGAAILEHLIKVHVRPPVTAGGIDAVLKTYMNLGQRQVIDFIVNQINRANGVEEGESDVTD